MPNVGDIIRAEDFNGAGIKAGAVVPFYNVTLSGRYPIFWGESEADTGWLVCDGGSDLHGGTVPNLTNRFIMGTNTVSGAKKTGGSTTTSSSTIGGNVGSTTLSTSTMPSHKHTLYIWGTGGENVRCLSDIGTNSQKANTSLISSTGSSGSHTHSLSATSHTHTLTPPYYTLIYLVKLP